MLENLILFFLSQKISQNFQEKPENIFFESKISSIEKKISDEKKSFRNFGKAGEVFDLKSGTVLWGKNQDLKLPMASLTKLMSILIILENHKLSEKVKIDANSDLWRGSHVDIRIGEVFTVGDLIKGALIKSGNNAVIALAKYNSGTVDKFVEKMNKRAFELGLKNTKFQNPIGFDDNGHYSSVGDLAVLAKYLYQKYDFVREVVKMKKGVIYSQNGRRVEFENTNKLLSDEVVGMKTGTTPKAGQCLISIVKKDGKELLFVVLGSNNRFGETRSLIKFIFSKI
ncbi:serine hydrolase [Candidatus Gracilibacteria bacterium]|nr:serine hydrolase [Candidatus Gracilibacteria bacterium]